MDHNKIFKPGSIVGPGARPRASLSDSVRRHIRTSHDYALWHEDYIKHTLKLSTNKLLFLEHKKSKFHSASIIFDAIEASDSHSAWVSENGNYAIAFDMGYETGYDAIRETLTTCVTVITTQQGAVVTVHPGLPFEPRQHPPAKIK